MLCDYEARSLLGDDECGDTLCADFGIGLCKDEVNVSFAGVGDPGLAAVKGPGAVFVLDCNGTDACCVGACACFGQTECEQIAVCNSGQICFLLLLGTPVGDHLCCNVADLDCQSKACAALCQLVYDNGAGDIVGTHTAVLFGNEDTAEAELIELCIQLTVESVILVHVVVTGLNFVLGELSYHVADHSLFFVEFNKHCCSPFLL